MRRFGFLCALLLTLSACAQTINTHGNLVRDEQLARLSVGSSSKMDVLQTLGSPTTKSLFSEETWYYITSTSISRPLNENDIQGRTTYVIAFDENGILADISKRTDAEDGRALRPSRTQTPTQGQAMGVIDQILQNLGTGQ